MARRKKRTFVIKANGGQGFFRPRSGEVTYTLGRNLMTAAAFEALSFSARLVLLDWLCFYYRKSAWESREITDVGIEYAYKVCEVVGLSEAAFLRARKSICQHGFFTAPRELQSSRPCSPIRWCPSAEWQHYAPSTTEAAALEKWHVSRARRIERGKSNRRMAVNSMERGKRKQAVKLTDISTVKLTDIQKGADTLLSVKKEDIQNPTTRQIDGHLTPHALGTSPPGWKAQKPRRAVVSSRLAYELRLTQRWCDLKAIRSRPKGAPPKRKADLPCGRRADLAIVEERVASRVIAKPFMIPRWWIPTEGNSPLPARVTALKGMLNAHA